MSEVHIRQRYFMEIQITCNSGFVAAAAYSMQMPIGIIIFGFIVSVLKLYL